MEGWTCTGVRIIEVREHGKDKVVWQRRYGYLDFWDMFLNIFRGRSLRRALRDAARI